MYKIVLKAHDGSMINWYITNSIIATKTGLIYFTTDEGEEKTLGKTEYGYLEVHKC